MFFQEATPDTSGYMIAGYAIAFLVMALYVASIYIRNRNLNQDMTMLEEMDKPAPPVEVRQPRKGPAKATASKSAKPVTKKSRKK
jgi:hypothetical protein